MSRKRTLVCGLGALVLVAGLLAVGARAEKAHQGHDAKAKKPHPPAKPHEGHKTQHTAAGQHIHMALTHLAAVEAAVKNGHKEVALKELARVRMMLVQLQGKLKDAEKHAAGKFVNVSCPIMAKNAIDPAKVTAKLTRTYKGKKVAFCCAGCPAKWDKLTDEEKHAKLTAVLAKKHN